MHGGWGRGRRGAGEGDSRALALSSAPVFAAAACNVCAPVQSRLATQVLLEGQTDPRIWDVEVRKFVKNPVSLLPWHQQCIHHVHIQSDMEWQCKQNIKLPNNSYDKQHYWSAYFIFVTSRAQGQFSPPARAHVVSLATWHQQATHHTPIQ